MAKDGRDREAHQQREKEKRNKNRKKAQKEGTPRRDALRENRERGPYSLTPPRATPAMMNLEKAK